MKVGRLGGRVCVLPTKQGTQIEKGSGWGTGRKCVCVCVCVCVPTKQGARRSKKQQNERGSTNDKTQQ